MGAAKHGLARDSRGKVAPLRKWRVPYEVSRGGRYPGRCSTITVTARQDCGARGQALEILKKRGFKPENIRIHLRLRPGAVVSKSEFLTSLEMGLEENRKESSL